MIHLKTAREAALQVLFQQTFQEGCSPIELFNSFADHFSFDDRTQEYILHLVKGVMENEAGINEMINKYSNNWRMDRIALLDKILLQIAIFELCISTDTPTAPKICVSDVIDLAKKYSSLESKNFINGILDQVYNQELSSQS